jgi:hypothetical protein
MSKSKIIHSNGPVRVYGRNEFGEYEVKNGRSIYYTDDKADACHAQVSNPKEKSNG